MGVTIEDFSPCHCRKRAEPGPGTSQWCAVSFSSVWYVESTIVHLYVRASTIKYPLCYLVQVCMNIYDILYVTLTICMAWCKSNGLSRLCSWLSFQARAPEKSQQVQHRWEWTQALLRRHFVPDNKKLAETTLETIKFNKIQSYVIRSLLVDSSYWAANASIAN